MFRKSYANEIVERLLKTNIKERSYALGVTGSLFSKDIGNDTERLKAAISLICLLLQTYQEGKEVKMETILDIILSAFPKKEDGMTIKQNFLRQSVTKLFCTESHFIYLLCTIQMEDAFDYDSVDFHGRVLAYKKTEGIDEYVSLFNTYQSSKQ